MVHYINTQMSYVLKALLWVKDALMHVDISTIYTDYGLNILRW